MATGEKCRDNKEKEKLEIITAEETEYPSGFYKSSRTTSPSLGLSNEEEDRLPPSCQTKTRQVLLTLVSCFLSVTIAGKVRSTSIISYGLLQHYGNTYTLTDLSSIGTLYSTIALCQIPVMVGLIDRFKLSYRFVALISGILHVLGSALGAGLHHPVFYLITDALMCGCGSALGLSVAILVIDDIFPNGHKYRILATSLCQGTVIGLLFVVDAFAIVMHKFGWLYMHLILATFFLLQTSILIILIPEHGFTLTVQRRYRPDHLPPVLQVCQDSVVSRSKMKLLSMTTNDMTDSPSAFPWLAARFCMELVVHGIFFHFLTKTEMASSPDFTFEKASNHDHLLSAFLYSAGEVTFYLVGAGCGCFIKGKLVHVYGLSSALLAIFLIFWQILQINQTAVSVRLVNIVFGILCGCCVGLLQTFQFAASEEATLIPARKIYPFVKLMAGVATVVGPYLYFTLDALSQVNIYFVIFGIVSAGVFCIFVYILHLLYVHIHSPPLSKSMFLALSEE